MAEQSLHADSLVFKIASSLFVMMQQKAHGLVLAKADAKLGSKWTQVPSALGAVSRVAAGWPVYRHVMTSPRLAHCDWPLTTRLRVQPIPDAYATYHLHVHATEVLL